MTHGLKCVTVIEKKTAYIPLGLPFGVRPDPSIYSTISECAYDLVNEEKTWDRQSLNSPQVTLLDPPEEPVNGLAVYILERNSFADGYIDDCLTVVLDIGDDIRRSQEAPPLIMHLIFRPLDTNDPLPRDDNISIKKQKGEGQPRESKVTFGWQISTVTMRIYLVPLEKAFGWSIKISTILKNQYSENKRSRKNNRKVKSYWIYHPSRTILLKQTMPLTTKV